MVKHDQLAAVRYNKYTTIHVDCFKKGISLETNFTWCGISAINTILNFLSTTYKFDKIKVCKKCSQIYRRKYGHTLESFLARLKVQNKLFVDH